MLQLLHIENIAIIECADIEFRPGFNALTGETGAGKSIVIDAMSAVLGQRTSRDLIRTGASKAFVSALFSHVDPALCEELGASPDENSARGLLQNAQEKGGAALRSAKPFTVAFSKDGSQIYRARFGGFDNQNGAAAACKVLKRKGFACWASQQ